MKTRFLLLALPLFAPPALAADPGMKAGLWEVKVLKQVVDGRDLKAQMAAAQAQMQQQMASMPPEQRKQMEAMMARQGVGMSGGAARICISPEMAARKTPMVDPEGRCNPAKVSHSGSTARFEYDCNIDGRHSVGKGETTFSGDTVTSRLDSTTTDSTGRHTMQMESQMTWLGASCGNLAPLAPGKK